MSDSIVIDIVEAVAAAKGVPISDLGYSLHDYIDTDALESIAARNGGSWTISFELPGHDVTVTSDDVILVDGRETERLV